MEQITHGKTLFALVLRRGLETESTRFFTPADNPLQLGILRHGKGYTEAPHTHPPLERIISEVQQVVHMTRGKMEVDFYDDDGQQVKDVTLSAGDTILLIRGGHRIKILEDSEGIIVKQGPFLGEDKDKESLKESRK